MNSKKNSKKISKKISKKKISRFRGSHRYSRAGWRGLSGLAAPIVLSVLFFFIMLTGCAAATLDKKVLDVAGNKLNVEIADTPESREQGLMNRKSMGEDEGMIFVFEDESKVTFWMKNTQLSLSIAFIAADGTIRQVEDMEPESLASVPSYRNVLYALEVNQGWFDTHGVKPGDVVDVSGLKTR